MVLAGTGYYMIIQQGSLNPSSSTTDSMTDQNLLAQTQTFIDRENQLRALSIDLGFFNDSRFQSLTTYTAPVQDQVLGKVNLFDPVAKTGTTAH